jgi:hypothetical protein
MGLKLSDLAVKVRNVAVDLGDGAVVNVAYRPHEMTLQDELLVSNEEDAEERLRLVIGLLARVLVSWDILGDDEKPLAITAKTLGTLPTSVLLHIQTAIREDSGPKVKSGRR